jgi:hypothetical protein
MKFILAALSLALSSSACSSAQEQALFSAPSYEIRFVIVEAPAELVARWIRADSTGSPVVKSSAADEFLAAVERDGSVTSRPFMTVRGGTTGHISNARDIEYTGDVDSDENPLRMTVEAGLFIEMTPQGREDGRTDVALSIRETTVVEPIREARVTPAGSMKSFTIQLPESTTCTAQKDLVLSADETALVPMSPLSATPLSPAAPTRARVAVMSVRPRS